MFLPDMAGTLRRLHSFLKRGGRLAPTIWGPQPTVQFAAPVPMVLAELRLAPPPPGRPGIFALSDLNRLARLERRTHHGSTQSSSDVALRPHGGSSAIARPAP
jgi:hypothetical protein